MSVPSRTGSARGAGFLLPSDSIVAEANAIGFTTVGNEMWIGDEQYAIECVGLAPYPGGTFHASSGFRHSK